MYTPLPAYYGDIIDTTTHTRTQARTHTRTHTHTHARTHTYILWTACRTYISRDIVHKRRQMSIQPVYVHVKLQNVTINNMRYYNKSKQFRSFKYETFLILFVLVFYTIDWLKLSNLVAMAASIHSFAIYLKT